MKSFIDKFFSETTSRFEFFLLAIPFVLWVFCFFNFFTRHLYLEADAIPYADHIRFYIDNLSKGVFPLWNPAWCIGVPNDFFLRRIGDVNPFLFLIIFFKWLGIPYPTAYLMFLGVYYFLANWAFYLIARLLFVGRFFAFTAYILFLFSSWGSEIFYNYIIIIFVPIIWFFYFLLCFSRTPQRGFLLGMSFCVGLILTTYIPFFFLTILAIFLFLYVIFYRNESLDFLKRSFKFLHKNKIFTGLCVVFLLCSCIPGLLFYKESKSGEFVLPDRHSGSDASSAVAVGIANAASGDIISHGYFDRLFDDHENIDMGDIYIPYIFFLILLCTVFARSNKLIFFLFFNILTLSLITVTSAAGVHQFLYNHVIIFKFIRQVYYFFWLAMLPLGILFSVAAFKSLLTAVNSSSNKTTWFICIIAAHFLFALFICLHKGVLWGAWAAIVISLVYFILYFNFENKISYLAGFVLFLLAGYVQSAQVYKFLDDKLFQSQAAAINFNQTNAGLFLKSQFSGFKTIKGTVLDPDNKNGAWGEASPTQIFFKWDFVLSREDVKRITKGEFKKIWLIIRKGFGYPPKSKMSIYYASHWFAILVDYIDPKILVDYTDNKFIFYDNVVPYLDSPLFFKTFQSSIYQNENIAYVSKLETDPDDWRSNNNALFQSDIDPESSGELTVISSDANTWVLKTRLSNSRFLVINDNYNSDWHAFINGRPARLLRANVAFKGLWVPPGESSIVLRFSDPKRYILHFSLIILFAGAFLYLLVLLKNKRQSGPYV